MSFVLIQPVRVFLNQNQGAVSAILSLLLVLLYFAQYNIQRDQLLSNKPHLEVRKYEAEGNTVKIWLSNLGHELATDLELATTIETDVNPEYTVVEGKNRLFKSAKNSESIQTGNSIRSQKENVEFNSQPAVNLKFKNSQMTEQSLKSASQHLTDNGVSEFTIKFHIVHSDLFGREYRTELDWSYLIETEESFNFEELIKYGDPSIE